MKLTRRTALEAIASATLSPVALAQTASIAASAVPLHWLGNEAPPIATGVSWGVPWSKGAVPKGASFTLTASGKSYDTQHWPLAYWPDGSLKWSGFAAVTDPNAVGPFTLTRTTSPAKATIKVTESATLVLVDTGKLQCSIPKQGPDFLTSLTIDGREVTRRASLMATLEDRSQLEINRTVRWEDFTSLTRKVTVEQSGPVRVTVKIEGVYKANQGPREWLPFTIRLYFYGGQETIRLVHTFIFDGDDQKDFISGLGLTFAVPLREQMHNRHVRFSGEGMGLWAEPLQPLTGRRPLMKDGRDVYPDQLAGKRIPNQDQFDQRSQELLKDWAVWDSYKLVQSSADGFVIQKRTNAKSCWLHAAAGQRATGLAFAGDVSGGLAVGVKNFWQSHPASLEVADATTDLAKLKVWLWSPEAPAMDLRHYDTKAHGLDSSYEDVQEGFSTAHGVARTSELTLFPSALVPTKTETAQQAHAACSPAVLLATPEYLHSVRAFGIWSLPNRSTAARRTVEDQLDAGLALYKKEVEQRHWYGFWDFGDVMHAYDSARHTWRYDIGGFAWDNTELGTDMWLWYSFLRTGRADVFRMAEAMTRHTSEVDTYHLGRFAGLGSRHNVRHWGCGAKEARISQAAYRRFHYYLTTDERTGDVIHESTDSDFKATEIDPMRLAAPQVGPKKYPGRVRGGPDWLAFAGNWMTEWERTGNVKYRDKILTGMDCIANMPYGFLSGPNNLFGYDPSTGKLSTLTDDPFGGYNLTSIMGGAQVMFELNEMIQHEGWQKAWLQYCRLSSAPKQVVAKDMTTGAEGTDASYAGPGRLAAYVYLKTRNPAFGKKALTQLTGRGTPIFATRKVEGPDVLNPIDEAPRVSTNTTAQSALNAIEILEMCSDIIPETLV